MKAPWILSVFLCLGAAASAQVFTANLSGPAEDPPNTSPGTGLATITYDLGAQTLLVDVSFAGLEGTVTAAHIHAPTLVAGAGTASVATQTPSFVGFPAGVTSGTYSHLFDLTDPASYRAGYITDNGGTAAGAEAALVSAMMDGKAYFNIHTTSYPGGEIRGFLAPVPEPGPTALAVAGALGAFAVIRRNRHR